MKQKNFGKCILPHAKNCTHSASNTFFSYPGGIYCYDTTFQLPLQYLIGGKASFAATVQIKRKYN